jgi:tetratricopeptide (TPR) repeat protein
LYFGNGDYQKSILYLEKIITYKDQSLREDLQCFARILNLLAHYESAKDELLEYQIKSVYRFLGKMNDQQQMQVEIFRFLRTVGDIKPYQLRDEFIKLRDKLLKIASDPVESRPFLYLDIISWLESKIENRPVQIIMQKRHKLMK